MKSTYTRDVSPEMMKELQKRDTFAAFVDYVKENKNNDLVTIWDVLPGYVAYKKMKYGAYLEHVIVLVRIKGIKTTNII